MKHAFATSLPAVLLLAAFGNVSAQPIADAQSALQSSVGPAQIARLSGVLVFAEDCDECSEKRAHPHMTVYHHKFGDDGGGGHNLLEDDWTSAGNRRCWGTPEDNICHEGEVLARCDDVHSSCGGDGGETLLKAALLSAQPVGALLYLVTTRSSFELDSDASAVTIYDCSGGAQRVSLPSVISEDILRSTAPARTRGMQMLR